MKKHTIRIFDMKLIYGVLLSLFTVGAFAQTAANDVKTTAATKVTSNSSMRMVKGLVVDASSGKPLAGIRIKAYNKSIYSSMTSEDGTFSINVPIYVTALTADADGFGMIMSPIDVKSGTANIKMYSDQFNTLYTGLIKASKEVSNVVTSLNADLSVDNKILTGLQGNLRAIPRSGQVGVGSMFLINGINSLVANAQPLIVIDGVMTEMLYNRPSIHEGFYNNILANLSVEDIESISLLKNGNALYGAKGGNGVLLIDTKRNKSMATKIDVNIAGSMEQIPNMPQMMDATDYRYYASELLGSTGTKLTEFKFLKSDPDYFYYNQYNNNTDWTKGIYQDAYSQLYSMSVQGGDDIAKYYLSVGYADANSTLKNFEMSRFNLRLNTDINLSRTLDVRFDASYSDITRNMRDDGVPEDIDNSTVTSVGLLSLIKAPILSPYQFDLRGKMSRFLSDADDYLYEVLGADVSLANPASLLHYGEGKNKNQFGNRLINLAITPIYRINSFLTAREHFSYTLVNTNANYYTPLRGMPSLLIEDAETAVENVAKAMSSHNINFSSDTRFDWARVLQAHTINLKGGLRIYNNSYGLDMLQGYNTGNDKTPNINSNLSYKTVTGVDDNVLSLNYYAFGDYNYQGKYFLSGGVSMEASSRFGSDVETGLRLMGVPWALFPSIQGSWLVTSEPWFKPNSVVNHLMLNAGYDVAGNDDINSTASRSYFGSVRLLNNISGLTLSNIGNTNLQWETTKKLSAGVEANMFDNKLHVSYNLFQSKTDNLLSLKKLTYTGGLDKIWSNDGELSNVGYDITLKYKLLNLKALRMEVGGTLAHYKNEITKLPGGQTHFTTDMYGSTILSQVGSPVGLFYGYKTNGVYSTTLAANTDGKYIILKNGNQKAFGAGDINFVSSDLEVNEADKAVIGDPNPDFYGNLFATISTKRVTLSAVFNYSIGNDIFNYQRMVLEGGKSFYNQTTALNNRWTTEGQVTDVPVITYLDPMGNSRFSDRWIEDGSFLRLKTLTLSYVLPINNNYLQGMTVWCAGNNLWTSTKYLGGDPENSLANSVLVQGIDRGLVSQGKSFSLGLKINI